MTDAYKGSQGPESATGDYNLMKFIFEQLLNRVSTTTLVKIVAIYNDGEVSPVGVVDVLPLVSQVDGQGNPVSHGTIFSIPYFRLQGGANAVIIDPQVDDIGVAVFADKDISKVKSTKTVSLPGSKRRFDMADGLFFGGFLNGAPTQYIRFCSDGIFAVSPVKVTVQAPDVEVIATNSAKVTAPVCEVDASTSATVKSPVINLSDGSATLRKLVMDNFKDFFNNHVHTIGGPKPVTPMDDTYLTSIVKGA